MDATTDPRSAVAFLRGWADRAMHKGVHDEVHLDGSAARNARAVTSELRAPRGGRPASGSVRWSGQGWTVRITLADGSRRTVKLDASIPKEDRAAAQACAARVSELARAQSAVTAESTEMSTWFSTWCELRRLRGQTSVREDDSHYRVHIMPVLGSKPVRLWTPDDLRALSRALDAKVQTGTLSWKKAANVWGTASKMCTDSVRSKDDRIRVRNSNPAAEVAGPDRGVKKAKQYLYPSEFLRFVDCPEVSLRWRRVVALLVYLYPRPGELRELRWDDVDLEHRVVHIHQAHDRVTGQVKETKTSRPRRVPIEPELLPLLRALLAETAGKGRVIEMFHERAMARSFRLWVARAGVARAELHEPSPTRKAITVYDLRGTGITWMAICGTDPLKIQHRAGHNNFQTTQGYIREAEALREGFGTVFPPLPSSLLGTSPPPPTLRSLADEPHLDDNMSAVPVASSSHIHARRQHARRGKVLARVLASAPASVRQPPKSRANSKQNQRRGRDSNPRNPCRFT